MEDQSNMAYGGILALSHSVSWEEDYSFSTKQDSKGSSLVKHSTCQNVVLLSENKFELYDH